MTVDELLIEYLDEQIELAQNLDGSYAELWGHIKDLVLRGGKRLRPRLVVQTYERFGGQNIYNLIPIAAAWEMLHVGLLILDDIMDGDLERRGEPTIEAIYGDSGVALLAGSLCISAANELVLNSVLTLTSKVNIMSLLQDCYKETIGGQLLDIDPKKHDPLKVAEHKTAAYSYVGPMLSGAMAAGAQDEDLLTIRQHGITQGIIFQLQNDLDDVEQDLLAGRHSSVIQAMEDLGSLAEAKEAIQKLIITLAEREGFEPSMELPPYRLSKAAH